MSILFITTNTYRMQILEVLPHNSNVAQWLNWLNEHNLIYGIFIGGTKNGLQRKSWAGCINHLHRLSELLISFIWKSCNYNTFIMMLMNDVLEIKKYKEGLHTDGLRLSTSPTEAWSVKLMHHLCNGLSIVTYNGNKICYYCDHFFK